VARSEESAEALAQERAPKEGLERASVRRAPVALEWVPAWVPAWVPVGASAPWAAWSAAQAEAPQAAPTAARG